MLIVELHGAIYSNDVERVAGILAESAAGDIVNAAYNGICSPLFLAITLEHMEIALLLIANGADIHARNRFGGTPLHLAAEWGQPKVLLDLLERGADPNIQNNVSLSTPLHYAVWQSHLPTIKCLLEHGANILTRDKYRATPFHDAVVRRDKPVIALLKKICMQQEHQRLIDMAIVLKPLKLPVLVVYTIYCADAVYYEFTVSQFEAWNLLVQIKNTQ